MKGKVPVWALKAAAVLILVLCGLGVGHALRQTGFPLNLFSGLKPDLTVSHETRIDTSLLSSRIEELNELATISRSYREVVDHQEEGFFGRRFIIVYDGLIKAGVDMDQVKIISNTENAAGKPELVLSIPQAKILSHEDYEPETIYEEGMNAKDLGEKRNAAISEMKKAKEARFIEEGLLVQARERAEEVLRDMIAAVCGSDVTVKFEHRYN